MGEPKNSPFRTGEFMGLTSAMAAWLVPSIISLIGTGAGVATSMVQAHDNREQAKDQKKTLLAQSNLEQQKAPELSADAGNTDAIKKRATSWGVQQNILANNNLQTNSPISQKETWG